MQTKSYTGGWFQQSSLDLEPLYRYLAFDDVNRNTGIDTEKLSKRRDFLGFKEVKLVRGYLNYVQAITEDKIEFRYFEDGLYTLCQEDDDYQGSLERLRYFEKDMVVPALTLFFSKGAPEPKVINLDHNYARDVVVFPIGPCLAVDEPINMITENSDLEVVYTDYVIFLHPKSEIELSTLIEMQIFFAEVSATLQGYLHQHRHVWELITNLREKKGIRPNEAKNIRSELLSYKTTVKLTSSRLRQMLPYLELRGRAAADTAVLDNLRSLFAIKLGSLKNSLFHVQEMWVMTDEYLENAMAAVSSILENYSQAVLKTVRIVTSLWGVNLLFSLITNSRFPVFSANGILYVIFLISFTIILELVVSGLINLRRYRLQIKDKDLFDK